jgi:serine/threonine protein phosphatase PrpC
MIPGREGLLSAVFPRCSSDLRRLELSTATDSAGTRRVKAAAFLNHDGPRMSLADTLSPVATLPRELRFAPRKLPPRCEGIVYTESVMEEVAAFEFAGGTAAVFSTRSPQKSTPNEDVAALFPMGDSEGILAVADGLGGHAGGERAARLTIERIRETLAEAEIPGEPLRPAILDGIEAANESVQRMGTGAATTLALAEIQDRTVRTYHVGDSAVLLTGQRGKLKLQTIAHSPIGYAVEAGLMNEADAIHHEERHMISNVIGSHEMRIEIGPTVQMAVRDTLVLASDGLFDNLLPDEIVDVVRSGPLEESVGKLVATALARMNAETSGTPSKPDDLTIIAFRPSS